MSTFESLVVKADQLLKLCSEEDVRLCTAESCTGGLVSACLTEVPGSSARFDRGFVTYSNQAKTDLLGVDPALLETHGAVSEEVARAMAEGALKASNANFAVAVTGIAGPGGGSEDKPVGLVYFGFASDAGLLEHKEKHFDDIGRAKVRLKTVSFALDKMLNLITPQT